VLDGWRDLCFGAGSVCGGGSVWSGKPADGMEDEGKKRSRKIEVLLYLNLVGCADFL
jgi:hypothetical protein